MKALQVSPVFSILEVLVQELITKMIYYTTNKVQLDREKVQKKVYRKWKIFKVVVFIPFKYAIRKPLAI